MTYIDCYLVPVPRDNKAAYEALARLSAAVVREHGALRVVECWLDESGPQASSYHATEARLDCADDGTFAAAAGARDGETVVVSYVEWPSKAARNAGMQKVTSDPRMQFPDRPPVFDGRRLIAAGFVPMLGEEVEASAQAHPE
jgi:uncharacterized protein YbaA (DUF1428 family)